MKLRLAALLAMTLLSACRHRRRRHCRQWRRRLCRPQRLPDRRRSRRDRRHHLVQSRRAAPIRRAIDVTAAITRRPRHLPGCGQRRRLDGDLHRRRAAPRCRARRGRSSCPISMSRFAAARTVAAKQVGQASMLNFAAGDLHALDPGPGHRPGQSRRGDPAGQCSRNPDPAAQGRRSRSGDRSAGRSGGPRGGRQRDLRASDRLPADPDQLKYNATR